MIKPGDEAVAVDGSIGDRQPNRLELLGDLEHERRREKGIDRIELRCHSKAQLLLGC
jgi:hypothetical protein